MIYSLNSISFHTFMNINCSSYKCILSAISSYPHFLGSYPWLLVITQPVTATSKQQACTPRSRGTRLWNVISPYWPLSLTKSHLKATRSCSTTEVSSLALSPTYMPSTLENLCSYLFCHFTQPWRYHLLATQRIYAVDKAQPRKSNLQTQKIKTLLA